MRSLFNRGRSYLIFLCLPREIPAHAGLIPFAEPLCELRALERAPASGRETIGFVFAFPILPLFQHSILPALREIS